MTNFWTISLFWALFLLFIGVALAFVLPPLLRRNSQSGQVDRKEANVAIYHDQLAELKSDLDSGELDAAQYEDAKREIEKRLSEDVPLESAPAAAVQPGRWPGYVLAVMIPVLAIVFYMVLGNPDALVVPRAEDPALAGGQHDAAPMVAALEAKMKKKPDDAAGWYMLARSYTSLGRYDDAARAFARLTALVPEDSGIVADYADVLAMTQGGNLQGKPLELINKALALNAQDEKALNLAGTAAYEAKDFAKAATYWRRLLAVVPADADYTKDIRAAAEAAEKAAGLSPGSENSAKPSGKKAEVKKGGGEAHKVGGASISGTVTVAKDLAANVSPTDTVFIFAQLPQGPKMPLASLKIGAKQLPYRFTLDDSLAMTPDDNLSRHPEVVVSARISKRGEAMPHSGDLQGKSGTVKLGQQGLTIVIDTVLP
ncbi:MAG: c-type cytochrome biogenesis protein CcmI [Betaproteobacteria bacterium]|nr:c-type cytochrome biogenesis protein CcmI [Betaproteobacteria bacterium]